MGLSGTGKAGAGKQVHRRFGFVGRPANHGAFRETACKQRIVPAGAWSRRQRAAA